MGLRFEYPHLLSWLALLPLLAGLFAFGEWRRRRLLGRFAESGALPRLTQSLSAHKRWTKAALLLCALAFGIVALARPQYGFFERAIPRKGIDVMIAIDTSASMLSQDVQPNRLQRARDQLKAIIRQLQGDRVGIIAFAGEAYLQCPLTTDYGIAQQVLDLLSRDSVPIPGTAIARAVKLAEENFEKNDLGKKVLVLLTDGEDQGSDPVEAAREAAKKNIIIHAIGIGSDEGAVIPMPEGGVKKDAEGHAVNTRLNFEVLKGMAAATGGVAIKARPTGFMELDRIQQEIEALQKRTLSESHRMVYRERYQWFLLPALLLLMLEMLISERKSRLGLRPDIKKAPTTAFIPLFMLLLSTQANAIDWGDPVAGKNRRANELLAEGKAKEAFDLYKQAQVDAPDRPELYYNLGLALSKQDKPEEALKCLDSASTAKGALKQNVDFNLGWNHYQLGKQAYEAKDMQKASESLTKAVQYNRQALKAAPEDRQAKHNFEQAKILLAKVKAEQQQQQQDQQKDQQKDQQQKDQQQDQQKQEQKNESQSQPASQQAGPKPTPTPSPAPTPAATPQPAQSAQSQPGAEPKEGELTKEQAARMLDQAGEEDPQKFMMLFVPEVVEQRRWVRDW